MLVPQIQKSSKRSDVNNKINIHNNRKTAKTKLASETEKCKTIELA